MEQFNLDTWLKDKSRKVVTRDGREVDIYYSPTSRIPLIGRTSDNEIYQYTKDGFQCDTMNQAKNDLFFSEEELTEFEKEYKKLYMEGYADGQAGSKPLSDKVLKECVIDLLDLARKEIYNSGEFSNAVEFSSYEKGKQDALKDLPKWKKGTPPSATTLYVIRKGYYMTIKEVDELFEILPKEE